MTREECKQFFPDTHAYFAKTTDVHPFWKQLEAVHVEDVRHGGTLLSDLEQVFSSLHLVSGHETVKARLAQVDSEEELLDMLTSLYVAYLYRNNGAHIVPDSEHGFDVELHMADQLLALGVVRFKNFQSVTEQFKEEVGLEIHHLENVRDQHASEARELLSHLEFHSKKLGQHPNASHQVFATVSDMHRLEKERRFREVIDSRKEHIQETFPHIAGVVVINPAHGKEQATFIPFHGDDSGVEELLNTHL